MHPDMFNGTHHKFVIHGIELLSRYKIAEAYLYSKQVMQIEGRATDI